MQDAMGNDRVPALRAQLWRLKSFQSFVRLGFILRVSMGEQAWNDFLHPYQERLSTLLGCTFSASDFFAPLSWCQMCRSECRAVSQVYVDFFSHAQSYLRSEMLQIEQILATLQPCVEPVPEKALPEEEKLALPEAKNNPLPETERLPSPGLPVAPERQKRSWWFPAHILASCCHRFEQPLELLVIDLVAKVRIYNTSAIAPVGLYEIGMACVAIDQHKDLSQPLCQLVQVLQSASLSHSASARAVLRVMKRAQHRLAD